MKSIYILLIFFIAAGIARADSINIFAQNAFKECEKSGQKISVIQALEIINKNRLGGCSNEAPSASKMKWSHDYENGDHGSFYVSDNFDAHDRELAAPVDETSACLLVDGPDKQITLTLSAPIKPPTPIVPATLSKFQKVEAWLSSAMGSEQEETPASVYPTYNSKRTIVTISGGQITELVQVLTTPEMKWDTTSKEYNSLWNDENPTLDCENTYGQFK